MTSGTDELRRMLDERGVEYFKHEDGEPLRKLEKADEPATSWHMGGASVCAVPIEGSDLFDLWIDHCTPAQAIAATLGTGTCHMVLREDIRGHAYQDTYECSECGEYVVRETCMGESEPPNYCPNCGRRCVG